MASSQVQVSQDLGYLPSVLSRITQVGLVGNSCSFGKVNSRLIISGGRGCCRRQSEQSSKDLGELHRCVAVLEDSNGVRNALRIS